MRARSTDLESVDAIDPIASEETALAGRTAAISDAEFIEPTTTVDPYPGDGIVVDSSDEIVADGNTIEGAYEFGGVLSNPLWQVDLTNLHVLEPIPGKRVDGTEGNDVIVGGDGNDDLRGWEGNDVIYGGAGHDFIYGGSENDELYGGDGDDEIWGGRGSDKLDGGAGNDLLHVSTGAYHPTDSGVAFGGAGDDIIHGSYGVDHLYGGEGKDQIRGYDGFDYLHGGDGDDHLEGGDGYDMLWGGTGDDVIYGESAFNGPVSTIGDADFLYGESGKDRLYGGGSNDHLDGGADDDFLHGGAGHDRLVGGAGYDRLTGGDGRDTFVITQADPLGYSLDVITDFMRYPPIDGGDIVDLSALFDAYTNFTGTAQEAAQQGYLYFRQFGSPGEAGYGTMIFIDPNGSAPDTHTYYHDMPVAFLEGVGPGELGTPGPNYGGLSNHFLV
jgi:Ca2+-binding RTX toxin-like protein